MPALDQLKQLLRDLEIRIDKAEKYKNPPDPGFFECIAGPWLSRHLMPRIDRESSCKFLRAYKESRTDFLTQVASPLFGEIKSIADLSFPDLTIAKPGSLIHRIQAVAGRSKLTPELFQHRFLRGVELRLATLVAMGFIRENSQQNSIQPNTDDVLPKLVKGYQSYFGTNPWSKTAAFRYHPSDATQSATDATQSAGFHALEIKDSILAESIKTAIRKMHGSFLDPAVAFVVDTIREASDAQDLVRPFRSEDLADGAPWLIGDSWVLVVQSRNSAPDRGMIMRLRIEPVECYTQDSRCSTVGAFYPHPHLGAFMQLTPCFQEGIRNAWLANKSYSHHTDYRWSLIPWDDSTSNDWGLDDWCNAYEKCLLEKKDWRSYSNERDRYKCLWASISGPSATLSYAIGLRSCMNKIHLRSDHAPSSAFKVPEGDCNQLTFNPTLRDISGIPAKREVLDRAGVKKLLVWAKQTTPLPLDESQWVKRINLEDAFQAATQIESILEDLAIESGAQWSKIANCDVAQTTDNQTEWRLRNEHRFDNYVAPQYAWQDPNPDKRVESASQQPEWILEPINASSRQDHLPLALLWALNNKKNIVLLDGAGAGKTVSSYKIQELLSLEPSREKIFRDKLPRVILRWEKRNFPEAKISNPTLKDLLLADRSLEETIKKFHASIDTLVDYLLESKRLVILVDAYDELDVSQRDVLVSVHKNPKSQSQSALWVITGRDYAINRETGSRGLFSPVFRRLRIEPFSNELQNEYMDQALGKLDFKQQLFESLGPQGWRGCLVGFGTAGNDWQELLKLPHNLKTLVQIFENWKPGTQLPRFESPSDLFLQTGQAMLERELEDSQRRRNGAKEYGKKDACNYLERALGAIALEMACRNWWKEVPGRDSELKRNVNSVITASKKRFLRGWEFDSEIENGESTWTWAFEILKQFEFLNGATGADINETVISFTTRRIQEMRAALYLTKFATPEDLVYTKVPKDCAQGHSGDRDWEELWLGTIRMPKWHQNEHKDRYRRAMEILFERPLRSQEQRRPTQWMWEVTRWVDPELDEHLRNHLGNQFAEILRGTDHRSEVARDLIDLKNFVILADPAKRIDRFDTGRFDMGGRQWDDTMVDKVPVELSKYGMCKYTLSNEQYKLFDDNFVETEQTWWFEGGFRSLFAPSAGEDPKKMLDAWHRRLEDFKALDQPAVFLSWYDSYWYSEFVNGGLVGTSLEEAGWKVLLPTEAQWEYGARAGGQGDYFRNKKGRDVTAKSLGQYVHFDQPLDSGKPLSVRDHGKTPNAWDMEMILGNAHQWVYDGYQDGLQGGKDPVEHNDDNGENGRLRVIRGGSWNDDATYCRSANRYRYVPTNRAPYDSLRLALSSSGVYGLGQGETE